MSYVLHMWDARVDARPGSSQAGPDRGGHGPIRNRIVNRIDYIAWIFMGTGFGLVSGGELSDFEIRSRTPSGGTEF